MSWFLVRSAVASLVWASAACCSACWLVVRFSSRIFDAASMRGASWALLATSKSRSSFNPFSAVAASSCRLLSRSASPVIWAIWRSSLCRASLIRSASRSHSPSSIRRVWTRAACSASAFRKGGKVAAISACLVAAFAEIAVTSATLFCCSDRSASAVTLCASICCHLARANFASALRIRSATER